MLMVLAQGYHDGIIKWRHGVQPVHTATGEYGIIHKLGDEGPLCLSSLESAMRIMNCNLAFPVTQLS